MMVLQMLFYVNQLHQVLSTCHGYSLWLSTFVQGNKACVRGACRAEWVAELQFTASTTASEGLHRQPLRPQAAPSQPG